MLLSSLQNRKHIILIVTLFFLVLLLVVFKFYLKIQDLTFVNYSSDTMRHLFLIQDVNHLESVPTYGLQSFLHDSQNRFSGSGMNFYVRGWAVFLSVLHKLSGFDFIYITNFFAFVIIIFGAASVYFFASSLFLDNKKIPLIASLLFLTGISLYNVTPHYFAAYTLIPLVMWCSLRYLATSLLRYLALFIIFWSQLQIFHSTYATLILFIFIIYTFYENFLAKNRTFLRPSLILLLTALTIYFLSGLLYFLVLQTQNLAGFIAEYTGVWAVLPSYSKISSLIYFILLFLFYYYVIRRLLKINKNICPQTEIAELLPQDTNIRCNSLWLAAFLTFLVFIIFFPHYSELLITFLFQPSGDLARVSNYPIIILFLLSLFKARDLSRSFPNMLGFMYLPFFVIIVSVIFFMRIPIIGNFFNFLIPPLFSIVDFSFFVLVTVSAYAIDHIVKTKNYIYRFFLISFIFSSLFINSIIPMYRVQNDATNPYRNFVEAYFWLKPSLRDAKIGSNFEYLRSLMLKMALL